MIDQPFTKERFLGHSGSANWMRNKETLAIKTSETTEISSATLLTTFPEIGTLSERHAFDRVRDQVQLTRYGMDCYAYALLAAGHVDLVIEAGLNAYDISAPIGVIQNSGGIVTDWSGNPAHKGGQVIAAATPLLHAQALALLGG
jgi:myo-inositol-1(or 4)-monophosphatase